MTSQDPRETLDPAPFPHDPGPFEPLELPLRAGGEQVVSVDRRADFDGDRFPYEPSPDADGQILRQRRWAGVAILTAALFLLVFNSVSIQSWSVRQAPGWISTMVQELSRVWTAQVADLGAARPREAVGRAYQALVEARFPNQDADSRPD